jgi:hypothetical protein
MDPFLVYSFCCVSFLLGMMVPLIIDYIACGRQVRAWHASCEVDGKGKDTE